MEFYYFITYGSIIIGLWNIFIIIWAKNPAHLGTAVGTLGKVTNLKNVRSKHGWVIPNVTDYRYHYTVGKQNYKISGNRNAHKRTLFKKVSVVYIKGLPRIAYIDKFTGENQWVAGIGFLFLGFMCLWVLHQGQ